VDGGKKRGGHNPPPSTDPCMLLHATAWLHSFPDSQTVPVSALDPLTKRFGAVRIETFGWHMGCLRAGASGGAGGSGWQGCVLHRRALAEAQQGRSGC